MIRANLGEVAERLCAGVDLNVEISIPGGAKMAERTANGRLGIVGGPVYPRHDRRRRALFVLGLDPFHP